MRIKSLVYFFLIEKKLIYHSKIFHFIDLLHNFKNMNMDQHQFYLTKNQFHENQESSILEHGITKRLLAKYKPSNSLIDMHSDQKKSSEQIAA